VTTSSVAHPFSVMKMAFVFQSDCTNFAAFLVAGLPRDLSMLLFVSDSDVFSCSALFN
jgi:hypothetical protein